MSALEDLRETMKALRGPNGCAWDLEQTHPSLASSLIEECCELLDTIDRNDIPHMKEELGDLLLQVYFHAQIAEDNGDFDIEGVAAELNEKLIRRHPHVFGDEQAGDKDEVIKVWESIKAEEKKKKGESFFGDIPERFPALMYARKVAKRLEKAGLREKTNGFELGEEEVGKELFELAARAYDHGIEAEAALRHYVNKLKEEATVEYQQNNV